MNPGPLNLAGPDAVEPQDFNETYYDGLIDCPRCHGEGEIGARGYSHNPNCGFPTPDPQCDTTARCPDCHGDGTVRPDDFDTENEPRPVEADEAHTHKEIESK